MGSVSEFHDHITESSAAEGEVEDVVEYRPARGIIRIAGVTGVIHCGAVDICRYFQCHELLGHGQSIPIRILTN